MFFRANKIIRKMRPLISLKEELKQRDAAGWVSSRRDPLVGSKP